MPLAGKGALFSPGVRVTLTALKWSGTSVTVGSLVAATTVRVIAGGAGVVCAAAEAASAIAPSSTPVVLNRIMTSPLNGWSAHHALSPHLLEWHGGFGPLSAGHRAHTSPDR